MQKSVTIKLVLSESPPAPSAAEAAHTPASQTEMTMTSSENEDGVVSPDILALTRKM